MKHHTLRLFLLLILWGAMIPARAQPEEQGNEYVLFLNSINFNLPESKSFYWPVQKSLDEKGIMTKAESLSVPTLTTRQEQQELVRKLLDKYPSPQAVIFMGDPGWIVCRELFDGPWKDVPVIVTVSQDRLPSTLDLLLSHAPLTDSNTVPANQWYEGYNVARLQSPFFVKETIGLMKQLMPEMNRIVFLSDDRYIGAVTRDRVRKTMEEWFPELPLTLLTAGEVTTKDLLDSLQSYDEKTGLIFYSWFESANQNDKQYLLDHIQEVINDYTRSPIFLIAGQDLTDNNFAGGYYIPTNSGALTLTAILQRILNGERAEEISLQQSGKAGAVLNYPYLQSHHIPVSRFPDNAVYINKPVTFFQQYRNAILMIAVALILIVGAVAVYIRILQRTDRKIREKSRELDTLNKKYRLILEGAELTPWTVDVKTGLLGLDTDLVKIRPIIESVGGTDFRLWIHPEDREELLEDIHRLIAGEMQSLQVEYRMRPNAGSKEYIWVRSSILSAERDNEHRALTLIGASQDITPRKKMETELRDAKEQAEESNRLKSAFLANMSHEIRTPLNAIVGFANVLPFVEDEEEQRSYIHIIETNTEQLLRLINDILDLSKIEAGTITLEESETDLNQMMDEILRVGALKLEGKKVRINMAESIPDCTVLTDRNRLIQVLTNFVTNAIKFTDEGEIRLGFRKEGGTHLRFYVSDTGCGINMAGQQEIFERFVKHNPFAQGMGLGLSISKLIIEKMEGSIGVESESGEGSTFWIVIPYKPV